MYSFTLWKATSKVAITISWLIVAFPITAPKEISTAAAQKSDTNKLLYLKKWNKQLFQNTLFIYSELKPYLLFNADCKLTAMFNAFEKPASDKQGPFKHIRRNQKVVANTSPTVLL